MERRVAKGWALLLAVAVAVAMVGDSAVALEVSELPYRYEYPTQYSIVMLTDPCKFSDSTDCCNESYGAMEYFQPIDPPELDISDGQYNAICQFDGQIYPVECLLDTSGVEIPYTDARTPDWTIALDSTCHGDRDPRYDCVGIGVKRMRFQVQDTQGFKTLYPECIDNNDTVCTNDNSCGLLAEKGDANAQYCMDVAFAQNAFVFQCRGLYEEDETCGTFIELHRQGETYIISDVRVPTGVHTGYNMIPDGISLRYSINGSTVMDYVDNTNGGMVTQETMLVCKGLYELWWVLRTRHETIVQAVKPFEVLKPVCDWDTEKETFKPYTLERNL